MKIRMTVDQSGTRNGHPWPARGTVIDLPDEEALGYVRGAMAVPVAEHRRAETAVPTAAAVELRAEHGPEPEPPAPVKRGPGRPRKNGGTNGT